MHNCRWLTFRTFRGCTAGAVLMSLLAVGCENPPPARPIARNQRTEPVDVPAVKEEKTEAPKKAQPAPKVADSAATKKEKTAPAKPQPAKKPAGPPPMPPVLLSEQHRKTCKVFVGDSLPTIELPDLKGKDQKLSDLLGKKLTLVSFFEGSRPTEEQMLLDLTPEVADRFGKQDVAVVGIAVGLKADAAAAQMKKFGVTFPVLVDTDRAAYDKVASDFLPRLFLVDADGKILWLDLEYSATTRRQISEAIRHLLETK